jgi:hypothetical protein
MASVGISEFTFGYAFLYEQTQENWGNLRVAPILPNLQQEQEEGWDAHLPLNGIDFYYQFKLSDHLSRRNATFIADGTYTTAYYRLAFHRKNNNQQHQRLRDLSQANPNTYYVAPEFNTINDFNASFLARQIKDRSRMIPVEDCDDVFDGEQHYITFQPGQSGWNQHSARRYHERSFLGRDLSKLYRQSARQWKSVDKPFADELYEKTSATVKRVLEREDRFARQLAFPLMDFNPHDEDRRSVLLRTSQILSVMFGATLVVVGTSP